MSQPTGVQVFAPAKINLTLHVTGQRNDGYHLLESLVVFADVGDDLLVQISNTISIKAQGPESGQVPADMNNLVLKVAAQFQDLPGAFFQLTKNLPVSSGIGGGSADAAAAFRGLMVLHHGAEIDQTLFDPSATPMARNLLSLGADIPVCLLSQNTRMSGIGETLHPVGALPELNAVLVNPRVGVSTPSVFSALQQRENAPLPEIPAFAGLHHLIEWLEQQRNDLEAPAMAILPEIAAVKAALSAQRDCLLARMSGSGATCFGLFADHDQARQAARQIAQQNPAWWVQPARLGNQYHKAKPRVF